MPSLPSAPPGADHSLAPAGGRKPGYFTARRLADEVFALCATRNPETALLPGAAHRAASGAGRRDRNSLPPFGPDGGGGWILGGKAVRRV
jgi:hypothetical protein